MKIFKKRVLGIELGILGFLSMSCEFYFIKWLFGMVKCYVNGCDI